MACAAIGRFSGKTIMGCMFPGTIGSCRDRRGAIRGDTVAGTASSLGQVHLRRNLMTALAGWIDPAPGLSMTTDTIEASGNSLGSMGRKRQPTVTNNMRRTGPEITEFHRQQ
ncbi:hypothetical protein C2E25_09165 [Geothermobacter hydrogeniphilus]|uniref:Uncharacterized protein n=1 Tax=Geothermobacter hydrogeniphilus TaxID=1969733 RepID=A0A2K2H9T9_9BACT|nr:hypothetical protein C2E25_09165 [Geothermobacter hydrogeniphilus]